MTRAAGKAKGKPKPRLDAPASERLADREVPDNWREIFTPCCACDAQPRSSFSPLCADCISKGWRMK
jgi:hypothetical protein